MAQTFAGVPGSDKFVDCVECISTNMPLNKFDANYLDVASPLSICFLWAWY